MRQQAGATQAQVEAVSRILFEWDDEPGVIFYAEEWEDEAREIIAALAALEE